MATDTALTAQEMAAAAVVKKLSAVTLKADELLCEMGVKRAEEEGSSL